nr:hypothetical protein [Tanacetum cinerariifolium]
MLLTHRSPPWNKRKQRSMRACLKISTFYLYKDIYLQVKIKTPPFYSIKEGERKQKDLELTGEKKSSRNFMGKYNVSSFTKLQGKIKMQVTSTAFFIFAIFVILFAFGNLFLIIKKWEIVGETLIKISFRSGIDLVRFVILIGGSLCGLSGKSNCEILFSGLRGEIPLGVTLLSDHHIPTPPGKERNSKIQRSSNSSATFDSQQEMFHEMMQQQYALDRESKMKRLDRETMARVEYIQFKTKNEDLWTLAIITDGMDPMNAAIIEEAKKEI